MDKIISLSAFGDVQEPSSEPIQPKEISPEVEPEIKETPASNQSKIFSKILQNMAQAKLLHWQSLKYGQHKALDELFDGIIDLGDTLAESIMGKYGRPTLSEEDLCLNLQNFKDPENADLTEFTTHLYLFYSEEAKSIFSQERDSEIINILDEIIALVDKVKYLLTLK